MRLRGIQLLTLCLTVCISVGYARAPKKIVNGQNAYEAEFPYQVSLQKNGGHFCGGSIIHESWIMTAAHCVNSEESGITPAHLIKVVTGVNDLGLPWNSRFYNVFDVTYVFPHEEYNPSTPWTESTYSFADIALLKLATPITLDTHRKLINLPEPSYYIAPESQAMVTGWGVQFFGHKQASRILKKLQMTVIDLQTCSVDHRQITDGNICARGGTNPSGTCQGDSGGPLVFDNKLIGLVSYNIGCGEHPTVFTNVRYFLPWIYSIMPYY